MPTRNPSNDFGEPTGVAVRNISILPTVLIGTPATIEASQRLLKETDMTKPTEVIEALPTFVTCPDCGGERFQVHERGALTHNPDGVIVVEYDELACQCLTCHHVLTLPVSGVIDYRG